MNGIFNKSIFSFFLCDENVKSEVSAEFDTVYSIGNHKLYVDNRTPIQVSETDGRKLIIFGYAVDVFSGVSENLAETALLKTKNLADIIDYERKLGGKYVVFYSENDNCYCFGDATCSVPIFYTVGIDSVVCCMNSKLIIDIFNLKTDPELQKIRDSGPLNQAMPFDITTYKEIKQLIPNHYIDFNKQQALRFVNEQTRQTVITPEKAAEVTAPMIANISNYFLTNFKIYCPLTSGRDSRVVFSFLKPVPTYTVWQDKFENDDQDWVIPPKLVELYNAPYEQIYHVEIDDESRCIADKTLGEKAYPDDAFRLALTLYKHYRDGAVIEGDIIGQVGKCSLHRDIPLFLAKPGYFRCKLHNYSDESKKLLGEWLEEIKQSKEMVNSFDLFSIENRLGRWAAQTHIIYNLMGQLYLNIFNSRSIIYTWTAVKRSKRKFSEIHIELIKLKAPDLLTVPFEYDKSSAVKLAKSNGLAYYFASYLKYYIQKTKFKLNN